MEIKKIAALDLFSGAGGFSLGMVNAGIDVVAAIEYDKKIAATYKKNHRNTIMVNEDIREVPATKQDKIYDSNKSQVVISELFPDHVKQIDIIFGGPPCQGFSMAGRRIRENNLYLEDERNMLFLDFWRMVSFFKPKIFILENVPGILSFDNGNFKNEIEEKFSSLGYNVSSKVLSSEQFGVPQKRKRAIFIGNRLGVDSEQFFPVETHHETNYVTVWDAIGDLPSLKSGEGSELSEYAMEPQNEYQKRMRNNLSGAFYNHVASVHTNKTIEILKLVKPGQTMKDLPAEYQTKSVHSGAYGRMKKDEPSYTLTTRINTPSVGRITHPIDDRTITPREAARIQSFPDNYHFLGDITSVGMQIGNSVPPVLGEALGKTIVEQLKTLEEHI